MSLSSPTSSHLSPTVTQGVPSPNLRYFALGAANPMPPGLLYDGSRVEFVQCEGPMRRLNVRQAQIQECTKKRLFALNVKPRTPELEKGELLLLQLVKNEALQSSKLHGRIEFLLEFDHFEEDHDGSLSRTHWPSERRRW